MSSDVKEVDSVCNWTKTVVKGCELPYKEWAESGLKREDIIGYVCPSCGVISSIDSKESGIYFNWWSGFEKSKCGQCGAKIPQPIFIIPKDTLMTMRARQEDTASMETPTNSDANSDAVTVSGKSSTSPEPEEEMAPDSASTLVGKALGSGAIGGAAAAWATHYFASDNLTFPIFIVAYVLMLSHLKGSGKLVGLVSFVIVGSLVLAIMKKFVV